MEQQHFWDRRLIGPSWFRHCAGVITKCSTRAPRAKFRGIFVSLAQREASSPGKSRLTHQLRRTQSFQPMVGQSCFHRNQYIRFVITPCQRYYTRQHYRTVSFSPLNQIHAWPAQQNTHAFDLPNRTDARPPNSEEGQYAVLNRRSVCQTKHPCGPPNGHDIRSARPNGKFGFATRKNMSRLPQQLFCFLPFHPPSEVVPAGIAAPGILSPTEIF